MFAKLHKYIKQIVTYMPFDNQLVQAQEELNELNIAISKYRRKNNKYSYPVEESWEHILNNLKEEIADVSIMLEQLKMYLDCEDEIEEIMLHKSLRTINRLRGFYD